MHIHMQLETLPTNNLTLTSIYRTFLSEDNVKSTSTKNYNQKDKNTKFDSHEDDDSEFDVGMLTLPVHVNVESRYVQTFNANIMKALATLVRSIYTVTSI